MSAQSGQNVNVAQLLGAGADKAFEANKDMRAPSKNDRLPEGIEGAVAQLKKLWIGKYGSDVSDKTLVGKPFYCASGVVVSPKTFKDKRGVTHVLEGRHTQIMPEPLVATPTRGGKRKTLEEHYGWMMGELMLLNKALETNKDAMRPANIQTTFNAMLNPQKPIFFRFRTWRGSKNDVRQVGGKWFLCNVNEDGSTGNPIQGKGPYVSKEAGLAANKGAGREPMVNEEWLGACPPPLAEANGEVEADVIEHAEGELVPDQDPSNVDGAMDDAVGSEPPAEEPAEAPADLGASAEEPDLAALVAAANADDLPAKVKLEALAIERAGVTSEEVKLADTWQDVANWIAAGGKPVEEAAAEPEPEPTPPPSPAVPKVGETGWKYQYKDANGQPVKTKAGLVEVEILTTSTKNKTATCKDLVKGVTIAGADKKPLNIPWAQLASS